MITMKWKFFGNLSITSTKVVQGIIFPETALPDKRTDENSAFE